ncbi:MAG: hypothetical protein KF850_14690 [Labilithrix sp.]|nr:hypothetical protein [Labilithrix sp.]MBX3213280.1 hypothetical protein [Labilithrix sp.]
MVIGIAGGLLAMSSLLVGRSAQAAEKLATLAKYQGWIGLTMFGWGVWELIQCVLNLGLIAQSPLVFVFWALSGVADFTVGLLLGFGLISTYAFRGNAMAIAKGDAIRSKLVAFQVPLGALAIVTSLGYGVLHFV